MRGKAVATMVSSIVLRKMASNTPAKVTYIWRFNAGGITAAAVSDGPLRIVFPGMLIAV
jgi:hypothetical protein